MTGRDYRRKTADQWKGIKLISVRQIRNGYSSLPAGTLWTVTGKFKGFALTSDPCSGCGGQMHVTKVHWDAVDQAPTQQKTSLI